MGNRHPEASILPPVVVEVDIPVTRRIKIHAVVDGESDQLFHSKRISEVFAWLLDNNVQVFTILDDDAEFSVTLSRPPPRPNEVKG